MANKILDAYERKYGVTIVDDSFYDIYGQWRRRYKVYCADGNKWMNGLTWKDMRTMFKEDGKALLEIKEGTLRD